MSSPFLAHTPMPYATTRAPRPDAANLVGLGISGLFLQNGTVFDGMGVLPRRDECTELGFFMDEADQAHSQGDAEGAGYPELEEDAWKKRIGSYTGFDPSEYPSAHSTSAFWSPPSASSPFRTHSRTKGLLPTEPEGDDIFYTRSPASRSSAQEPATRKEVSRATVSGWFRNMQSPRPEDEIAERLARVL